jgi:hypothetical protein
LLFKKIGDYNAFILAREYKEFKYDINKLP